MWSRAGLPKPDRFITDLRYLRTLESIFGFSTDARAPDDIRQDRLQKPRRLRALLSRLGCPHERFPIALIAGTKGKGSTAAMLASMLHAGGLRTGRYTQPHLVSWRERTWVNGRYLSVRDTIRLFPRVRRAAAWLETAAPEFGPLTTFEVGTALSLLAFAEMEVDVAVVEVGVGGRFDATNAVEPALSVVTPISFDHADVIGPTLRDIAHEKAGVMRAGRPAIISPQVDEAMDALRACGESVGARMSWVGHDWVWREGPDRTIAIQGPSLEVAPFQVPLLGAFQRENATAAVAALAELDLLNAEQRAAAIREGMKQLHWPGRVHIVQEHPIVVLDGAHNAESARQLVSALASSFPGTEISWVIGLSRGKDIEGFVDALRGHAVAVTCTSAAHSRSTPAEDLAALVRQRLGPGAEVTSEPDPTRALNQALAQASADQLICVAGSFFLLGDLYSEFTRS